MIIINNHNKSKLKIKNRTIPNSKYKKLINLYRIPKNKIANIKLHNYNKEIN
jgi:hypothetical protein